MKYADIKIGYSCNNNCIHCVISNNRKYAIKILGRQDRTTQEYIREITQAKSNGYPTIIVTGGEPTIRKDITQLVNHAKKIGLNVIMQTNARMLSYKELAQKLAKYDINYTIALHGHTKQIHDQITRANGSFKQTVQAIKNLAELKQKIEGKTVISKKNYQHLKEMAQFFISLGVEKMNFAFPHPQGNAFKNFDQVVPTYTELENNVHTTIEFIEDYNKNNNKNVQIDFEAIPFCFMQGYEKYVSETKFTEEPIELNIIGATPTNWNITRKQIKHKSKKCIDCKYNPLCEGVWTEYAQKNGDLELKPKQNKKHQQT
jgi:MoaA/NifB/PqqE/SkfB family radical SAM enzyme